ncbi:T9SS type A sorting domain-containing protein [Hanstruepera marina]|uniref:T9SS type A sorting domain-containing protein n=1 Tax=Hanstruepera marina TaxID=2873265 RepID=UPI001CA5F80C|nr:T9SS type A sorting domain-containing protein [Hanstruepera marina]
MKTKLLMLVSLITIGLQAQTTHDLIWERGFVSPQADLTIDVGDTVRWTWTDDLPHTVENNTGSTETFDSGILTGLGQTYSYTFTVEGTNPYFCGIHGANNMSGVITVQQGLSVVEFENMSIKLTPNPVHSNLSIKLPQHLTNGNLKVVDLTGKIVLNSTIINSGNTIDINVSDIKSGMYLVRLEFNENTITKRLIIQ